MSNSRVELQLNSDAVRRRVHELAAQVTNNVAHATRQDAEDNAPEETGNLKEHIVVTQDATPENPLGALESQAPYSGDVNFGHHAPDGSHVAANPFFTSALERAPQRLAEMNPKLEG